MTRCGAVAELFVVKRKLKSGETLARVVAELKRERDALRQLVAKKREEESNLLKRRSRG